MRSSKRILMVNDHIHFGGGGDAVFRLEREAYEQAGHDVQTFSQAEDTQVDASGHDMVHVTGRGRLRAKVGKFVGAPGVYRALKRVVSEFQPNLIRVHLVSKYPADIYPALEGYPVVQTLHGPNLFCATSWGNLRRDSSFCELGIGVKCWTRGCVSLAEAALYASLDARVQPVVKRVVHLYHCPSRHIQGKADSLGYGPTVHIPLGVDRRFLSAAPATHEGPPVVIYVGGLIEAKGVLCLPEALRKIKREVPDVTLVICGRGPLEATLKQRFTDQGLSSNVEFRGFVDRDQIVRLYQDAHVFVCPSIYSEQFGLVGVEALACGVPCVGSDVGGIPEWLSHGEWGWLVPPRDTTALAGRVAALLLDRDKRLEFGRKGRSFAAATHHPAVYQQHWLDILQHHGA